MSGITVVQRVPEERDCERLAEPGIYFWLAEDGETYVGQSLNPQSRLREHWRNHRDIVRACFVPCAATDLDRLEAELIEEAGRHFLLRNIKLAVATAREVPFDTLISSDERERFLAGHDLKAGCWNEFEHLTQVQKHKFSRFLAVARAIEALTALQLFVRCAIPKPAATEVKFWSATIFPSRRFVRLNAGQQEVFTVNVGAGRIRVLTTIGSTSCGRPECGIRSNRSRTYWLLKTWKIGCRASASFRATGLWFA